MKIEADQDRNKKLRMRTRMRKKMAFRDGIVQSSQDEDLSPTQAATFIRRAHRPPTSRREAVGLEEQDLTWVVEVARELRDRKLLDNDVKQRKLLVNSPKIALQRGGDMMDK